MATYMLVLIFCSLCEQGSLGQILFWTGLFEIVAGWPAMNASIEGKRIPGDFGFDPLGVGKKDFARMQVTVHLQKF